ncbi:MAG: HAMP domain-containing protein [Rhodobacteraceae bacterium]|nr:HAMP domain-containing protein [Paracoccaceae bacterium]
MVVRVFVVIWGALVLTLLLFGLLVAALGPPPPRGVMIAAARGVVERQLTLVAAREGGAAALTLWSGLASAHPDLAVARLPACADDTPVRGSDGICLEVTASDDSSRLLEGLRMLLSPLLVGFGVSAAAALVLSRHLTRPIRTVNAALQRLASGDLDTRIGGALDGSSAELARLGDAFDHAAERLQKLAEGRRTLFKDLSHEIRSPLARLRAAVGLLEVSPHRLADMLRQIETDILRLDALVSGILTLARYDSAAERPAFAPIDLVDILEPILSDANFEGQVRDVSTDYEGPSQLPLFGNAELLHRAIENVVRNALSHSPPGSEVAVRAARDRSGTGLGLAIVARAIAAHGGTIHLADNRPSGLCVGITLPCAPDGRT